MRSDGSYGKDLQAKATGYAARLPERLVLDGYRGWLRCAAEQDERHLEAVKDSYCRALGYEKAQPVLEALTAMIRELGACANCPLRFTCASPDDICRDECLVLGMIAGLQNGDEETAFRSASALGSPLQPLRLLYSAGDFALALRAAGQHLLPVAANTMETIIAREVARSTPHTLH